VGIGMYSYWTHWRLAEQRLAKARFRDVPGFVRYCARLGAQSVQVQIAAGAAATARSVRSTVERVGLVYEGQATLPEPGESQDRFLAELNTAKQAGATLVRTIILGTRRYESLDSRAAWDAFRRRAEKTLAAAEPRLRALRMRLAVENHKDFLAAELAALMRRFSSEWLGVCLDIGNNIALCEDNDAVIDTLVPYTFTAHLKDMAWAEGGPGFLLSEVPLGEGALDLRDIIGRIRRAQPAAVFNVEMITRDPLTIPCLTDAYWATMPRRPAAQLARALARVRGDSRPRRLPRVAGLDANRQLDLEDEHVRRSFERVHRL
jgi:3-oxoisoapionate decarboxylase